MSGLADNTTDQAMFLDPAIRDWVLFPITVIMVLVGVFRHQLTILMTGEPPKPELKDIRQGKALMRGQLLAQNNSYIPTPAFIERKKYLCQAYEDGVYLKNKASKEQSAANLMADPKNMEVMMDGMKKQMMGIVPQTLIMGWIQFFFSGFILIKLPFPLGVRFKQMLQSGIMTPNMDVKWVSSLSWYFINLFGLRGVFSLILGGENSADGTRDMTAMSTMGAMGQQPGQPQDFNKQFLGMKDSLSIIYHEWDLDNIEQRVLVKYGKQARVFKSSRK
ncbi:transmembrane protein [Martensiomyces pterosporus]|nr:transmembrane protein [Martensiomyces pterosporus]